LVNKTRTHIFMVNRKTKSNKRKSTHSPLYGENSPLTPYPESRNGNQTAGRRSLWCSVRSPDSHPSASPDSVRPAKDEGRGVCGEQAGTRHLGVICSHKSQGCPHCGWGNQGPCKLSALFNTPQLQMAVLRMGPSPSPSLTQNTSVPTEALPLGTERLTHNNK
jgi:hypothetical protein